MKNKDQGRVKLYTIQIINSLYLDILVIANYKKKNPVIQCFQMMTHVARCLLWKVSTCVAYWLNIHSQIPHLTWYIHIYLIPCIFQNNFNQHLPIKNGNFLKSASTMKHIKYHSTSKSPTRRHLRPLPNHLNSRWYRPLIPSRTAPQQESVAKSEQLFLKYYQ